MLFTWSTVFAYTPSTSDYVIVDKISTLVDGYDEYQLEQFVPLLEGAQSAFMYTDERKYWYAQEILKVIDKRLTYLSMNALLDEIAEGNLVEKWDMVEVHYVWSLDDGTVFDTSIEDLAIKYWTYSANRPYQPLRFEVWAGQMIAWFDNWVFGMYVWEERRIVIPAEEWYWEWRLDMVQEIPMETFEEWGMIPVVWEQYNFWFTQWVVVEINEWSVYVDFNHFLAWETLIFDVELIGLEK